MTCSSAVSTDVVRRSTISPRFVVRYDVLRHGRISLYGTELYGWYRYIIFPVVRGMVRPVLYAVRGGMVSYDMAQNGTLVNGTDLFSAMIPFCMVRFGTARFGMVWFGTVHGMIRYSFGAVWRGTVW